MPWLRRHVVWAWPAVLVTGLLMVVLLRLHPSEPAPLPAASGSDHRGVVGGQSDDLASSARQIRGVQDEVLRLREQLTALQADLTERRHRVATLADMLAADRLTDSPGFLASEATVRALQQIIREAADAPGGAASGRGSLDTAATVARERLRTRLQGLHDQTAKEAAALETRTDALRAELRLKTDELQRRQRQVNDQLQGRTRGTAPLAV